MIRIALVLFLLALALVAGVALQADAGVAQFAWLGVKIETTAAAALLGLVLAALIAVAFWRALIWALEAPARGERRRTEARRRQSLEALTQGFIAVAGGRGAEARALAQKALDLAPEASKLSRLLTAQAAGVAGDLAAARAAYGALLGDADLQLAAYRGLMKSAQASGDWEDALQLARAAYTLNPTAPWALRAVAEADLRAGDWAGALARVEDAVGRKVITPAGAARARAALQTVRAAEIETTSPAEALELAQTAAKARPDFTPAAVIAARLLVAEGRGARAAPILEAAWAARPHPALWLALRDLRPDETPKARASRLAALAAKSPEARESRFLMLEQALIAGDLPAARAAAQSLAVEPVTARLAGALARLAQTSGAAEEARTWIARAAAAPEDEDWSDIDRAGRAFPYDREDWRRVATRYAESGLLIHPRAERGSRGPGQAAPAPSAYETGDIAALAAENGAGLPPIVDDGDFGEALQPGPAGTERRGVFWLPLGRRKA
jgi:HemY protein